MLYRVAMDSLEQAIADLKKGDALARAQAVTRAQEAVTELSLALDHSVGASFTHTLASLYAYVLDEILKGHAQQSESAFRKALAILSSLHEAWEGVKKDTEKSAEAAAASVSAPDPVPAPQEDPQDLATRYQSRYSEREPEPSTAWNG